MPNAIIDTSLISAVVNAVREKGGTTDVITLGDLPQAVADLPSGGGDSKVASVLGRTVTEITADDLNGLTSIGDYACYNCNSLKSITFPETLTSIGTYAFMNNSIESISFPNSLTKIGSYAFRGSGKLKTVRIGENLSSISVYCFGYSGTDSGGVSFYINRNSPPTMSNTGVSGSILSAIYVPSSAVETYKTATNWSKYADVIFAMPE